MAEGGTARTRVLSLGAPVPARGALRARPADSACFRLRSGEYRGRERTPGTWRVSAQSVDRTRIAPGGRDTHRARLHAELCRARGRPRCSGAGGRGESDARCARARAEGTTSRSPSSLSLSPQQIARKYSSQSLISYTILSHRPSGSARGEDSARTQREI